MSDRPACAAGENLQVGGSIAGYGARRIDQLSGGQRQRPPCSRWSRLIEIRRDQERLQLRAMLLDGAQSAPSGEADTAYFAQLRKRTAPRTPAKRRA